MAMFCKLMVALLQLVGPYLLLSIYLMNFEKLSSFECGLEPLPIKQKVGHTTNARFKFDLLFYLISLLYLIFDLELVLLFPFALMSADLLAIHSYVVVAFFILLVLGFYYEYLEGGLSLDILYLLY